jgi:hypothetical protein
MFGRVLSILGLGTLLTAVAVPAPCLAQAQAKGSEPVVSSKPGAKSLQLTYSDGLLSGRADAAPVAEVLGALGDATGAKVVQRYTPQQEDKVSFFVEGAPFREALKKVLAGFNYVILPAAEPGAAPTVILIGREAAPVAAAQPTSTTPPVAEQPKAGPWDLEAFRPLTPPPAAGAGPAEGVPGVDQGLSQEEREALEADYRRERVDRDIAALKSPYRNLHEQALADIQGLDDPRVTSTLRDGALGKLESTASRRSFAQALWQHAADLEFRDSASVQALEELAATDDPGIKSIAARALADRDRYLQRQAQQQQEEAQQQQQQQ